MTQFRIDLSAAPSAMERLAASWGKAAPPARRVTSNPPARALMPAKRSLAPSQRAQAAIARPTGCWLSRVLKEG
ncbi:hypothetical protein GRI97_08180 [Altererythrobacter xixiisoli]|uniref:Uncharacterized protein n=1 Tax=Croceibacterium xixiisoli TaxID=1476466 RepID=A0A6I4TSV8_9SPHN|nr:hypothetical protein [Croceibacterium xixiisoli]MXO98964.1 hypothetical protein [Croceibacterium xixiisoli]